MQSHPSDQGKAPIAGPGPITGRAPAAILALALLLANLPFAIGYAVTPPGARFWGVAPVNAGDANQYLAFIRAVREGQWLLGDPFTTEPHAPRLLVPLSLAEGGLARLAGWAPPEAYQVSRVLCGAFLLAAGWWLGRLLLPRRLLGWYAAFLGFSAGAGWLLQQVGGSFPHGDLLQPEGNTFFMLGNLSHVALAAALLTALFAAGVAGARPPRRERLGLTAAAAALLAWFHPFDLITLALGLGSLALLRWMRERRFPADAARHAAAAAAGALPAGVYLVWLTATDPVYRALASDSLRVQSPAYYAAAHGLLLLPALAALAVPAVRRRTLPAACWVGCVLLFMATPLRLGGKQSRVIGGIHAPLAVLAVAGLDVLGRRLARRLRGPARRLAPAAVLGGFLAFTATGAWGMAERQTRPYLARRPDFYLSPSVQQAFAAVDRLAAPGDVLLGGAYTGGWAPTWTGTRAFVGHWHMTLDGARKAAERNWFFTAFDDPRRKGAWLRERGITWVVWYPWEWGLYSLPLEGVAGLRRVLSTPDLVLYHFTPPVGGTGNKRPTNRD